MESKDFDTQPQTLTLNPQERMAAVALVGAIGENPILNEAIESLHGQNADPTEDSSTSDSLLF